TFYDRGIQNDMEKLSINCYACRWSGLFKNYEVIQVNFINECMPY
ncbi:unnamed protein product, partial [Rotaria magnacalcarata]